MIGLLSVKVSMRTKEQITLSKSGERVKTSGHFYGQFREFVGCCTLAVTGGSGANGLSCSFVDSTSLLATLRSDL